MNREYFYNSLKQNKMETQSFTHQQLVEFGNYLLSPERRKAYKATDKKMLKERLSVVNHADVENCIESFAKLRS